MGMIGIIAPCHKTGDMVFDILTDIGWKLTAFMSGKTNHLIQIYCHLPRLCLTKIKTIDKSALFAGRHFGILKDAQDYLAWEEDLPNVIPPLF